MARIPKAYVREIRDALGRYPTWPPNTPLTLGQIGIYRGRAATFEWRTSLVSLGVDLTPHPATNQINELYSTKNAVQLRFVANSAGQGEASFGFRRAGAVATQTHGLQFSSLPLDLLEAALLTAINSGQLRWNKRWLVVTGLFQAASFTALISSSRRASASITATAPGAPIVFNIADPAIGLRLSHFDQIAYQAVAERDLQPYFCVHRLAFPLNGHPRLKPYGPGDSGMMARWHRYRSEG
jgi:hypothetical protein